MNAHEKWMPVKDFPYQVSSLGRVMRNGRVLSPKPNGNGYLRVCFCVDGKRTDAYIHRLVCAAFHGDPPAPDAHADHINGIRDDNRAINIRWLTPSENRSLRTLARGATHGQTKLTEDQVRHIISVNDSKSDRSIAKDFAVSREQVRDIRLRKSWRHISCSA